MKNEEIRLQREKQNRKIEKYMCATWECEWNENTKTNTKTKTKTIPKIIPKQLRPKMKNVRFFYLVCMPAQSKWKHENRYTVREKETDSHIWVRVVVHWHLAGREIRGRMSSQNFQKNARSSSRCQVILTSPLHARSSASSSRCQVILTSPLQPALHARSAWPVLQKMPRYVTHLRIGIYRVRKRKYAVKRSLLNYKRSNEPKTIVYLFLCAWCFSPTKRGIETKKLQTSPVFVAEKIRLSEISFPSFNTEEDKSCRKKTAVIWEQAEVFLWIYIKGIKVIENLQKPAKAGNILQKCANLVNFAETCKRNSHAPARSGTKNRRCTLLPNPS
jgi:hypothetical protein